ncbi:MAG TPA: hypothetical protein VGG69_08395 [Rhizomicrobium sp.]
MLLSSEFDPPLNSALLRDARAAQSPAPCRVRLAALEDDRVDSQYMGEIGGRPVRADTMAWLRSGLALLGRNPRLQLVQTGPADVVISVRLLKAYVLSITTQKSANVAVKVRYAGGATPPDEQVYRGNDVAVNWVSGSGEAQAALNSALNDVLYEIERDLLSRCGR